MGKFGAVHGVYNPHAKTLPPNHTITQLLLDLHLLIVAVRVSVSGMFIWEATAT